MVKRVLSLVTLVLVGGMVAPLAAAEKVAPVRMGAGIMTFDTVPGWGLGPDGKSIYFLANMGVHAQLFEIPAEGGKAKQLTDGARTVAAWSGRCNSRMYQGASGLAAMAAHSRSADDHSPRAACQSPRRRMLPNRKTD